MGKGNKHVKHLKSEKAKVKLKAKKQKHLPKGLNITDPSFKVKKIVIREQLKQHNEGDILSRRKLNIKDLLSRLHHHNSTVRQEAVKELKDILSQHSSDVLGSQLSSLLQGIAALSLDKEKDIRRDSLKVLNLILSPISTEQLLPFSDFLTSYLVCAMTHIDPRIKEDSLLFLDVIVQNCGGILSKVSHKILPIFLDMISKLHAEAKPGRQLTTTLSSRNTSVKWRIKVLERLSTIFKSIVQQRMQKTNEDTDNEEKVIHINSSTQHVPIFNEIHSEICIIPIVKYEGAREDNFEDIFTPHRFLKYVSSLMPLMFDSWIEVCPTERMLHSKDLLISEEAAELLKHIVDIIQSILECILVLHTDDKHISLWINSNFCVPYSKNLFSRFPYSTTKGSDKSRKRQNSPIRKNGEKCIVQNLALCQIYVWFTVVGRKDTLMDDTMKSNCNSIIDYLNEQMHSWCSMDNPALPQLLKVLRTLFFTASETWYKNGVDVGNILRTVIDVCTQQSKKEMQSQLFTIISDVILDHSLHKLHSESALKEFVLRLPSLLLKPSIHETTIEVINKAVLRYKDWVLQNLVTKQEAIIENAKNIEIIGTHDEKRSRLTICNLFYLLDGQIYY